MSFLTVPIGYLLTVSVRDFGARGDGQTDDTAAIQRAANSAVGKILYFPAGKYRVTTSIVISSSSHRFVGDLGQRAIAGGTEIAFEGTGGLFEIGTDNGHAWDAADYDGPQDMWFEHLWMSHAAPDTALAMGVAIGSYKAGAYGIRDWRGGGVRIDDCGIEKFEYSFWGIQSDINEFDDVTSLYSHFGIYAGPRSDQFTIRNLYSFFCDQALIVDKDVRQLRLIDPQIVGCGTATLCPIDIRKGASSVRIVRPWFEHLQGYVGTDQPGFVAAGITNGYAATTTSAKHIVVEDPLVTTSAIGQVNHTRCIVSLGAAQDVRVTNASSPVGTSDTLNLDAFVIAPAGTAYTNANSYAGVFDSPTGLTLANLFLNEGTGTPRLCAFLSPSSQTSFTSYNTIKVVSSADPSIITDGTADFGGQVTCETVLRVNGLSNLVGGVFQGLLISGAGTYKSGNLAPNGNVIGSVGDVYTTTAGAAGTVLWIKESGSATNTGWVTKSLVAPASTIAAALVTTANVETRVVSMAIPANTLVAGGTYSLIAYGVASANGTAPTLNVRLGPTTLTGPVVATLAGISSATGGTACEFSSMITIRTIGATGTAVGVAIERRPDPTASATPYDFTIRNYTTAPVTIDTTVANTLELTINSNNAGVTYSISQALIRQEL